MSGDLVLGRHDAPSCKPPRATRRRENTAWSCPDCGRVYVLRVSYSWAQTERLWILAVGRHLPVVKDAQ